MGVNQEARAGKAWVVLADLAKQRRSTTYTDLGEAIGVHERHLSTPLGWIQEHCLDARIPPLTILVHRKGGRHGTGFIAWDVENLEEGFEKVFAFNWQALGNPFAYALLGETQDSLASKLLVAPERSEDVYRKVADRGIAQQVFRTALLEAYDGSCAFCGFSFPEALEAAHIVPWSQCSTKDRVNVRNGLLLCATHHRLFDSANGCMSVTPEYVIRHREEDGPYDRFDTLLTKDLHEQKLRLPKNTAHNPDRQLLRQRAELATHDAEEASGDDEEDGDERDSVARDGD